MPSNPLHNYSRFPCMIAHMVTQADVVDEEEFRIHINKNCCSYMIMIN